MSSHFAPFKKVIAIGLTLTFAGCAYPPPDCERIVYSTLNQNVHGNNTSMWNGQNTILQKCGYNFDLSPETFNPPRSIGGYGNGGETHDGTTGQGPVYRGYGQIIPQQ